MDVEFLECGQEQGVDGGWGEVLQVGEVQGGWGWGPTTPSQGTGPQLADVFAPCLELNSPHQKPAALQLLLLPAPAPDTGWG